MNINNNLHSLFSELSTASSQHLHQSQLSKKVKLAFSHTQPPLLLWDIKDCPPPALTHLHQSDSPFLSYIVVYHLSQTLIDGMKSKTRPAVVSTAAAHYKGSHIMYHSQKQVNKQGQAYSNTCSIPTFQIWGFGVDFSQSFILRGQEQTSLVSLKENWQHFYE